MSLPLATWRIPALALAISWIGGVDPVLAETPGLRPPLQYTTTWVGNTFGGGSNWVQNAAEDLTVLPDGTCVVGSFWDEAGREVGIYRLGQPVGRCQRTHMRGGKATTASSKYIFYANTAARPDQPPVKAGEAPREKAICYFGVSRFDLTGRPAPFPGGQMPERHMAVLREDLDNHDLVPRGLATDGVSLFLADTLSNRVVVFDAESMKQLRSFPVDHPERLADDAQGRLWIIPTGGRSVRAFKTEGVPLNQELPLPPDGIASSVAAAPDGSLLVTDNGKHQQVLRYEQRGESWVLSHRIGVDGGIYAPPDPGATGPWRFCGPTGAGMDARGRLYVACNVPRGGTVLRAFAPKTGQPRWDAPNDWTLEWELLGLEFVDVADAHPETNGTDLFTADDRYAFEPGAASGRGWRWIAHTLDPFRFPDDPRLHLPSLQCGTSVRVLGGKTFLCQRGMWQGVLGFYRMEGNTAVPSVLLSAGPLREKNWSAKGQPAKGRWFWRDLDGDGQTSGSEFQSTDGPTGEFWASNVDARGDIWQAGRQSGIWRWSYRGLDARGNPIHDLQAQHWPMPAPFTEILRTEYDPTTDSLLLTGLTADRPMSGGEWGTVGTVVIRYDEWSRQPKQRYRIDLPYQPEKRFMVSLHTAGDLIFVVECKSAEVEVYHRENGQRLGSMKPGPEVHGESGWIDFRDALRATRLSNGDYLVLVEEDFKAKILVYELKNPFITSNR